MTLNMPMNMEKWYRQSSQISSIFSKAKQKWMDGPKLPIILKFINACGLSLNRTTVIFIGASLLPFEESSNDITISYDFQSLKWYNHEKLPGLANYGYPLLYTSCTQIFDKDSDSKYYFSSFTKKIVISK